jgi:hypothetical protein
MQEWITEISLRKRVRSTFGDKSREVFPPRGTEPFI